MDEKKLDIKIVNTKNSLKKYSNINYEKDNQIVILNNKKNILQNENKILKKWKTKYRWININSRANWIIR